LQKDDDFAPQHSGKFQKLKELVSTIAAQGEKLILFSQFRELTDVLAHFLSEIYMAKGLVLHGGVSPKRRSTMVDEFQRDGGPPFLVLSLKAGGTGLNLTAASHVLHFDR
jgi:SNF2 family DNA or RNA helicase